MGPFYGRRYRFEYRADGRRLELLPGDGRLPALRPDRRARSSWRPALLYFGRIGRDADEFRIFAGSTDLIRGNTSGSYRRNECRNANDAEHRDRLRRARPAGRHPDRRRQRRAPVPDPESVVRLPAAFPPHRGRAVLRHRAWPGTSSSTHQVEPSSGRRPDRRPHAASRPSASSLRANLFGFAIARLDYSIPQDRPQVEGLWTFSLGPTF